MRITERLEGEIFENGVNVTRTPIATYVYFVDGMEIGGEAHYIRVRIPNETPKDYSLEESWEKT